MPSLTRRTSSSQKSTSSRESGSRRSKDSYESRSTAPTSAHGSPQPSHVKKSRSSSSAGSYASATSRPKQQLKQQQTYTYGCGDISPGTSLYPRSSVDTYASTTASEGELIELDAAGDVEDYEYNSIPPLPMYTRDIVEPNVRTSSPQDFAKLFPSLNRLSIRHDEYTADGNMNLRIDTVVTGRRRTAIQLFHLRMYDLAKREFSLRRYCRDSGREVCNSKRKYAEPPEAKPSMTEADDTRPTLQRSMSTALKTLSGGTGKPGIRRTNSGGSFFSSKSSRSSKRPGSSNSYSSYEGDTEYSSVDGTSSESLHSDRSASKAKQHKKAKEPTNTIKLEFSNYARVDIHRRGKSKNKRYEFEWWGHRYAWKRSVDKQLGGLVSFHLLRDGDADHPVAHVVPETRSPSQVLADESAGGWVPPCFMWIADESVLDALTDVADVIMATGLMALVDDCIKERWQTEKKTKKVHHVPVPLTHGKTVDVPAPPKSPKSFLQHVFGRRNSRENNRHDYQYYSKPSTPMRFANPISAH